MKIQTPKFKISLREFTNLLSGSFEFKFAFVVIVLGLLSYYSPKLYIPIKNYQQNTITVTGYSEEEMDNNTAVFSINLNENNPDKAVVVKSINDKLDEVVAKVKAFGIPAKDIKSTYYNVYLSDKYPYDAENPEKIWYVATTLEVKLRDISKVTEFTELIASLGYTEFFGPNYSFEDSEAFQSRLLGNAIDNAKAKAMFLAQNMNKTLGSVISISEDGTGNPIYYDRMMGGAGGAGLEPGGTQIAKSVVVTFELR